MASPPSAKEALVAKKNFRFNSKVAGPILQKLVYGNKWEYIKQDGYQVLEEQEEKATGGNMQDAVAGDDPDYPKKRLRKQSENASSSMLGCCDAPGETSLKKPKVEADVSPEAHLRERQAEPVLLQVDYGGKPEPESPQADNRRRADPAPEVGNGEKTTELALLQSSPNSERPEHDLPLITCREERVLARACKVSAAQENVEQGSPMTCSRDKQPAGERPRDLFFEEPMIEPGTEALEDSMSTSPPTSKDKEDDDQLEFVVPIAMIPPHHPHGGRNEGLTHQSQQSQSDSSLRGISCLRTNASESLAAQNAPHKEDKGKGNGSSSDIPLENGKASVLLTAQEASSSTVDIASSDTGAVKLLFSFNSDRHDLLMSSIDALFKTVEERCLKSYKILLPDFSLRQVMKDVCQIASELTTEPRNDKEENNLKSTPVLDSTRKSNVIRSCLVGTGNPAAGLETKRREVIAGGAPPDSVRICTISNVVCNSDKPYGIPSSPLKPKTPTYMEALHSTNKAAHPESLVTFANSTYCDVCKIDCQCQQVLTPKPANAPAKVVTMNANQSKVVNEQLQKNNGPTANEDIEMKKQKVLSGGAVADDVRVCTCCNVVCTSELDYNFHITGKKHAAVVKKQQQQQQAALVATTNANTSANQSKAVNEQLQKNNGPAAKEDLETKKQKVLSGGVAADDVRVCTCCNVVCISELNYNFHITGKKHAALVKKQQQQQIALVETTNANTSANQSKAVNEQLQKNSGPAEKEDLETKKQKVLSGGVAADDVRVCPRCNVVCISELDYNFHIAGKKHAAVVKKQQQQQEAALVG